MHHIDTSIFRYLELHWDKFYK